MFLYRMKVARAVAVVRQVMTRRQEAKEEGNTGEELAQAGLHLWALSELVITIAEAVCVTMAQVENLKREREKGG